MKENIAEGICKAKAAKIDGTGKAVLITGGSGGIGRALAEIFAEHKFNLLLAARNSENLEAAARELEERHRISVQTVCVDLSQPSGAKQLYDEIKSRGIKIDQFVNNAGAGKTGDLIYTDDTTLANLITLNVTSFTLLNKYIGADMVKNGTGKILNVASLSAYLPDPGLNVYGATKAYERYLGEAMLGELQGTGITISTLCPGPVKTNWSANAGRKDSRFSLTPETVAKAAFTGMQKGKTVIVPGARFKILKAVAGITPTVPKIKFLRAFQNSLKKDSR